MGRRREALPRPRGLRRTRRTRTATTTRGRRDAARTGVADSERHPAHAALDAPMRALLPLAADRTRNRSPQSPIYTPLHSHPTTNAHDPAPLERLAAGPAARLRRALVRHRAFVLSVDLLPRPARVRRLDVRNRRRARVGQGARTGSQRRERQRQRRARVRRAWARWAGPRRGRSGKGRRPQRRALGRPRRRPATDGTAVAVRALSPRLAALLMPRTADSLS